MAKPNQIRAARALLGWQQKDLATISGVSELSIIKIEGGKTSPQQTTMNKLISAFEMAGVVIHENKVEFVENALIKISDSDWFKKIVTDMSRSGSEEEVVLVNLDELNLDKSEKQRLNRLHRGNDKVIVIGKNRHSRNIHALCYDNKIVIIDHENPDTDITLFRDAKLSELIKNLTRIVEHAKLKTTKVKK